MRWSWRSAVEYFVDKYRIIAVLERIVALRRHIRNDCAVKWPQIKPWASVSLSLTAFARRRGLMADISRVIQGALSRSPPCWLTLLGPAYLSISNNNLGLGGVRVSIIFGNDLLWNDVPYSKGFMKFKCLEPLKIMFVTTSWKSYLIAEWIYLKNGFKRCTRI